MIVLNRKVKSNVQHNMSLSLMVWFLSTVCTLIVCEVFVRTLGNGTNAVFVQRNVFFDKYGYLLKRSSKPKQSISSVSRTEWTHMLIIQTVSTIV